MLNNFKRLIKDETGAIHDYIGLIIFLFVTFGLLVPLVVELLIYNNQGQELDRITKLAAQRACNLMPSPVKGVGSDVNQGAIGVGTDMKIMQPLVNAIFRNETAHPETYFENTPDKTNIQLRLLDPQGGEIDKTQYETVIDKNGNRQQVLLVGTNADSGLCPAGGGPNWKYCLRREGDAAATQALASTGLPANEDLVARMEMFQAGRCGPGRDCSQDFAGRLDRCNVCATKTRESIFSRSAFIGQVLFLDCRNPNGISFLPCKLSACATSSFIPYSGKRGYSPTYKSPANLGAGYNNFENNANSASIPFSQGSESQPDSNFFCLNTDGRSPIKGSCL